MKNYLFAIITLFLSAGTIQAQVHPGIKGGLNAYSVIGNQDITYVPKLSYHFGVLTHIHMGERFALQPEAIYSAQGARYENSSLDLRLKYVNVPVLFQYMFGNGIRLQAGPQLGLLASAKTEINGAKEDVKSQYEGADFGVTAGVSYVKPDAGLGFDLRYNQGLTNINGVGPYNSFNSGVQLGIFYLLSRQHELDR
jgi:hypothetical protein